MGVCSVGSVSASRCSSTCIMSSPLIAVTKKATVLLLLFVFIAYCSSSKYSEENNSRKIADFKLEELPFRMRKVNLLWEKAKKRLSGTKLADLYADLLVHDKHEAALKKYRSDGMDKEGLKEAHVHLAFREIIEKFGMDDIYQADGRMSNEVPIDEKKEVYFSDKKLQTMWQRAEKAGFTARDLDKLRQEFWHQQMKIDEMNFLKKELDIEDITDNAVEPSKKTDKTDKQLKALNQDMKKKHKNIKAGFYDLEGRFDEYEREEADFQDSRVHQLWAVAQKTGWTDDELRSFKEELRHFESRLQKHEFFEDQLERSAETLTGPGIEDQHYEKHQNLEEKTSGIGSQVKKLHIDLKTRVTKAFAKHTEL